MRSRPVRLSPPGLVLGLVLVGGSSGCGECDGAVRTLEIRSVTACGLDPCDDSVLQVGADVSIRVVGDGPADDSAALLADSGIDAATFFLVDASDVKVAATVAGDSGGHTCRSGVGFSLQPAAPLEPGTYTVVVDLDALRWPLVGGAEAQTYDGRAALVRAIEVTAE